MKKYKAYAAQDELAKSQQSVGAKLEAPVQLTPEQLETVVAGFMVQISHGAGTGAGSTATTGLYPAQPISALYPAQAALKLK
jgi:hypothetical protein